MAPNIKYVNPLLCRFCFTLLKINLLLLLLSPFFSKSQISFANAWTSNSNSNHVHTAGAGTNRLLVFVVAYEDDDNLNDVTAVSYGGQALTQAVQMSTFTGTGSQNRVEIWYLNQAGIAAATNNTFIPVYSVSSPSTSHGVFYFARTLAGVNQSTPICGTGTGARTSTNNVNFNVSGALSVQASEMVIYGVSGGGDNYSHNPAAGYSEGADVNGAGGGQHAAVAFKPIVSNGTENPIANSSSSNNRWIIGAIRVIPNLASCESPLPIELGEFKAKVTEENLVQLDWETYSEKNNEKFEIEKSNDAINFQTIGTVKTKAPNGNSSTNLSYHFIDSEKITGTAYYSLKQIDFDGTYDLSKIISLTSSPKEEIHFTIYPNPNSGEFTADISGIENNHQIIILLRDISGSLIYKSNFFVNEKGNSKIQIIPDYKLIPGVCMCSLILEEIEYKVKVVVN